MTKKIYLMVLVIIALLFISGCKGTDIVFPDIAGTWDWVLTFDTNTCDSGSTQTGFVVITRNDSDTETTTGTIRIYVSDDTSLTCPLWTLTYTLDSNGNLTVNQTLQFDPQQCSTSTSPDTMGDIQMSLVATDTSISGTYSVDLYDTAQSWNCTQAGNLTLKNKQ